MATLDQDTFSRANQSGWGTASGGSTWAFSGVSETLTITSNEGVEGSLNGGDWHAQLGSTTAATVNILVRLKVDDTNNFAGVMGRYSSAGGINGYRIGLYAGTLKADKFVTGTRTQIGTPVSFSYTTSQFVWVRSVISGTTITGTAWLDGNSEPGSPQFSTTDSSVSAAGLFGLSAFMNSGNNSFNGFIATDNSSVTTKTRTITPVTVALKTTSTRTVPDSAALKTTNTRTVSDTAALKTTNKRTVTDTVALKTTNTRTVGSSATLKTTTTRTATPVSATLKTTNTRVVTPASAALKTVNTRSLSASAALEQTGKRTVPATAALKTTPTRSVPDSAALLTRNTRSVGTQAALLTTSARTVPTSATLAKTRTVPCTACLSSTFIFIPNAMLLVPSGQTTLLVPSGQTSLIVPSGQTTLII